MFNFSKRILISIGILIFIYAVLITIVVRISIDKILLQKQLFNDIPNLFAVSNNTALLEGDFATVSKNLEAMMNQMQEELCIAYVCILDPEKNPITFFISPKISGKSKNFLEKKFDKTENIKVRDDYDLLGVDIKEVLVTVGSPVCGIIRVGYLWDDIQKKIQIIQFAMLTVTIIALICMIIIATYLHNSFNLTVSEYIFNEKKNAMDTAKQNVLKEIELKNSEKQKRQSEIELTQSEIFMMMELFKDTLHSNDFMENMSGIANWFCKIFDAKNIMIYLMADNNQYLYCVYGIESGSIIEGNSAYEKTVVIGEGELGLAAQHKNYVIGDTPKIGYSISGPFVKDDITIGGITISHKKDVAKKFDSHDKLVMRTIMPALSSLVSRFLRGN